MPKGKKKGKYEHKRTEQAYSSDEDAGIDMTIDNCSETSGQSDLRSNHDEADNEVLEKLEEKVLETIDGLTARSNTARASALITLRSVLQRRNLSHVLVNHRATLADHVSRMLKRGKDGEKRAAASIAPILALQIGDEGIDEFMREVRTALSSTTFDKTTSLESRTECCTSLAALCYLFEDDLTEILEVMRIYETIFSGSYLKGDGTVKVSTSVIEEGALHASAIDGWALLLTLLPSEHAYSVLKNQLPNFRKLAEMLEAASVEVRMAAGNALAIAHECIAENEELPSDMMKQIDAVMPRLDQLSKDSNKYRAKKDRKLQRATFRDILKYFEDDEVPTLTVRVGIETATFDTWATNAAYTTLAASLGATLQTLAPHSAALRSALGLSDVAPQPTLLSKANKRTLHQQNNAASKVRQLVRSKNRDNKRSGALVM